MYVSCKESTGSSLKDINTMTEFKSHVQDEHAWYSFILGIEITFKHTGAS